MSIEEIKERLADNRYVLEVNSEGIHLDNTLLASDTAKLQNIGAAKLAMLESMEALHPSAAQSFKDWFNDECVCGEWFEMRADMAALDVADPVFLTDGDVDTMIPHKHGG